MIRKKEVFKIGQFAKPHGVKGEISLVTGCDLFDTVDDPYVVCEIDGILVPFFIEEYRYKSDTVMLVKLEGVDNEKSAREFSGREVFFPLKYVEDEDCLVGDMSWDGFVGYTVVDERHGTLGRITDVDDTTLNVLFQIDHGGSELLLPAAEELIVSVSHDDKTLRVSVPEGLLNL